MHCSATLLPQLSPWQVLWSDWGACAPSLQEHIPCTFGVIVPQQQTPYASSDAALPFLFRFTLSQTLITITLWKAYNFGVCIKPRKRHVIISRAQVAQPYSGDCIDKDPNRHQPTDHKTPTEKRRLLPLESAR